MADDCAICGDLLFDSKGEITTENGEDRHVVQLPCKHMYHEKCIQPVIGDAEKAKAIGDAEKATAKCPLCRSEFTRESMRRVEDKSSAQPVERLPRPTPAIVSYLKSSAERFEGDLNGFIEYSIAQLGKKYELTDAFLTDVFNKKIGGRRRRKTKRNIRRRLKNRRKTSKRFGMSQG